jgi:hypothetical protein
LILMAAPEFRMSLPTHVIMLTVIIVVLSLGVSILMPAFAQSLSNVSNSGGLNNTATKNLEKIIINANGPIASALRDTNGTWIIWGDWDLLNNATDATKIGSNPFSFNASITKVKPDNTESNKYKIYDFKLASSSISTVDASSILTFNGTGTIDTRGQETLQVPISMRIIDSAPVTASIDMQSGAIEPSWAPQGGTIQISIDDEAFPNHFGNTPVYGIVKKAKFS